MKSTHGSWSQEAVSAALQAQVGKVSALQVTGRGPWDYPTGMMSNGVFLKSGTPEESLAYALGMFPGSKTFLWYKNFDQPTSSIPPQFFANASGHGVIPQIGFEAKGYTLPVLRSALTSDPGRIRDNMIAWADYLKDKGPVIFRPLSEMNDSSATWQLGYPGNTPQDFATVWINMHSLFDQYGATNLRWTFDVAAFADANTDRVRQALLLIPPQYIDNMGMNPYSMMSDSKMFDDQYESFETLCQPWMQLFARHSNTRLVISEMGVSNNPKGHNVEGNKDPNYVRKGTDEYRRLDTKRKQWIHQAFAFARANHFASVTYFTQMDTNWRVDPGSQAFQVLQQEIQNNYY